MRSISKASLKYVIHEYNGWNILMRQKMLKHTALGYLRALVCCELNDAAMSS